MVVGGREGRSIRSLPICSRRVALVNKLQCRNRTVLTIWPHLEARLMRTRSTARPVPKSAKQDERKTRSRRLSIPVTNASVTRRLSGTRNSAESCGEVRVS
jgi:hypothetical protein